MALRYRLQSGLYLRVAAAIGVCAVLAGPAVSSAQEPPNVTVIVDDDGTRYDLRAIRAQSQSQFRLFGEEDRAFAGMRALGNMEYFVTNTGIIDGADGNWDSQPDLSGCAACGVGVIGQWFDVSPIYAAPRSEWERFIEQAPSLLNAKGQGYSVAHNAPTLGRREILASDFQRGVLFSGAVTTIDGSCLDHSGPNPGFAAPGESGNQAAASVQLLAISDCPATWPIVDGTPTFLGDHPVPPAEWKRSQTTLGPEFSFDWWRVDSTRIDRTRLLGDHIQTYGAYDDYNSAMIGRFGKVVPGGVGAPADPGWPLGLRTEFNAFNFENPSLLHTMFWRAIIINETEDLYGVGFDYQNLYVGYTVEPLRVSENAFYMEVWRGVVMTVVSGTGNPRCPGSGVPGVGRLADGDCIGDPGFGMGATGFVVLKSPIGDLRNVLFSCSPTQATARAAARALPCPTDEFFDPGNPHAGDTITYNHFRMCPFGGCTSQIINAPERQWFGGIASNTEDLLNGRDPSELSADAAYSVFRNPNFPNVRTPFAFWVPGSWNYSANGPTPGGDTLWVSTCYGPPGVVIHGTTRQHRDDACTVTWSDTMPVGELGNPAYHNQEGNQSFMSIGPFQLAAGDTTALVIALAAGVDSVEIEQEVNSVIEHYLNFYPIPTAPDPITINVVDIEPPDPVEGRFTPKVTLFWDDAAQDWVDPFLTDFADRLAAAATPELARIAALNPTLENRTRTRAADNVERLLIFKSCNDGRTFTAADVDNRGVLDCDGDRTLDLDGQPIEPGWQAYASLHPNADSDLPNAFRDTLALAGQSYLYIVAGETRGGVFLIDDSLDTDGDGVFDSVGPDSLVITPKLINPVVPSIDASNQTTVYLPASVAAGGARTRVTMVGEDPSRSNVPFAVRPLGDEAREGLYRVVFANRFEGEEVRTKSGEVIQTRVAASDIVTVAAETSPGLFTAVDSAIEVVALQAQNPNSVQFNSGSNDAFSRTVREGTTRDTILTTIDELGFLLYRVEGEVFPPTGTLAAVPDPTAPGEPLLISSVMDGVNTTPPTFVSRQREGDFTGFPGFVINADRGGSFGFDRQVYRTADGVEVIDAASPTIQWNEGAFQNEIERYTAFGDYVITWHDRVFGPGEPFHIDPTDRDATRTQVLESLLARQAASTTRISPEAASAIGVVQEQLSFVELPFTIRNTTFDRDVGVTIRAGNPRTLLLGDPATNDTVHVEIPEDIWIPGDPIFLIETVETDSVTSIGVVLGSDGKPIQVQRTIASFQPAWLDCGNRPRTTCNPVVGPGSTLDWIPVTAGLDLIVTHISPFRLNTEFRFQLEPPTGPAEALALGRDIRPQMDSIKAVPNPYILASKYQVAAADRRLLFTHLPPRGTLRIFTVSGQFVQQLRWGPSDLSGNGDLFWDMRTREGLDLAAGLYVFVVEARNPATGGKVKKIGKFVVVR